MKNYYCPAPLTWTLAPRYAGWEQCSAGHRWTGTRDHFLLHYIIRGKGVIRSGRRAEELGPGDVFLYWPDSRLDYRADVIDPWRYAWVGFSGTRAEELVRQSGSTMDGPVLHPSAGNGLDQNMKSLVLVLRTRACSYVSEATGLLYLVLADLARHPHDCRVPVFDAPTTLPDDRVACAKRFIEQNYQREIKVCDIGEYVGLSRSHLSRLFAALVGITMQDYLEKVRMKRAAELVRNSTLTLAEVAASVGYRDYETFERRFRVSFGDRPSDIRASSSDRNSYRHSGAASRLNGVPSWRPR